MRTQSADTSPAFERIQIARIRSFPPGKKFQSVRSWTQTITAMNSKQKQDPLSEEQEREHAATFIEREYGSHLKDLFRGAIIQQRHWKPQAPDVQEALLPLLDVCERLSIPSMLIGSMAESIYGFPRAIHDLDLLLDGLNHPFSILVKHLAPHYLFDLPPSSTVWPTHVCLLHLRHLIKLDVFLPTNAFAHMMLQRRQTVQLIEGRPPFGIATPEDLILQGLLWYSQSANGRDDVWNDLLGVLKVQALTIDGDYLCQQARTLHMTGMLERIFLDAGFRDGNAETGAPRPSALDGDATRGTSFQ